MVDYLFRVCNGFIFYGIALKSVSVSCKDSK